MMNRRSLITALPGVALFPFSEAEGAQSGSKKKGWAGGNSSYHQLFRASWYYTWTPKSKSSKHCEFVPMIKSGRDLSQLPAVQKMSGITSLLGFNEPSRVKQANMTVEAAIKAWPRLVEVAEKNNLRIGSPGPTSDKAGLEWHSRFMETAKRKKLRVDFVAMHWYGGPKAEEFENFIARAATKYRKPIWITEFNGWNGSEEVNYEFLKKSLKYLERSRDVERYAYFNPKKGSALSLLKSDNTPTRMGQLYQET